MQLTLSERDLELMPPELRRQVFLYLGQVQSPEEDADHEATPLDRSQVVALVREVSFHPDGRVLHALLEKFGYAEDGDAPDHDRLAKALLAEESRLRHHLAVLNRLTSRAANQPHARLWRYHRDSRRYAAHPTTRQTLRDVLSTLARSGKDEEPLWEG
jgi:hypothetical protein